MEVAALTSTSLFLFSRYGHRRAVISPVGHRTAAAAKPLFSQRSNLGSSFVAAAANSPQNAALSTAGKVIVDDNEFSLAKVSFGVIGLAFGGTLLSYGFGAYFTVLPGSERSALMLTYGFPLTIIGMALKYAELKPVPCTTYSDAEKLRETCATPILKQAHT